jgi:hypothetical protein
MRGFRGRLAAGIVALAALGVAPAAHAEVVGVPLTGAHTVAANACALAGLQKNPFEHGAPPSGTRVCWIFPDMTGASQEVVGIDGVVGVWTEAHGSARGTSESVLLKLGADSRPR